MEADGSLVHQISNSWRTAKIEIESKKEFESTSVLL
jgi:hypothetical protein